MSMRVTSMLTVINNIRMTKFFELMANFASAMKPDPPAHRAMSNEQEPEVDGNMFVQWPPDRSFNKHWKESFGGE